GPRRITWYSKHRLALRSQVDAFGVYPFESLYPGLTSRVAHAVRHTLVRGQIRANLRSVERRHPILVHQMGKDGSSTVVETLKNLELGVPIVHTHTLRASTLKKAIQKERTSGTQRISGHLIASSILIPKLENGLFPSTVITLTREPTV